MQPRAWQRLISAEAAVTTYLRTGLLKKVEILCLLGARNWGQSDDLSSCNDDEGIMMH